MIPVTTILRYLPIALRITKVAVIVVPQALNIARQIKARRTNNQAKQLK